MKKFINWLRDLLYNFTDYAIILCVVAIVASILIWRFDVLFNLKIDKDTIESSKPSIEISDDTNKNNQENNSDNSDSTTNDNNNQNNQEEADNPETPDNSENSDNTEDNENPESSEDDSNNVAVGTEITINIPAGTFPNKIADILLSNGLIADKKEFFK